MPSSLPLLQNMPNFNIKVIFLVHFIFTSLATMGFWASNAYFFYNSILIILLIWSMYRGEAPEPVQLAIVVNGSSILLDVLILIMCYPTYDSRAREHFSAAMAILNLLVRPCSTYLLIQNLEERSGSISGNIRNQESYEDIDRNVAPAAQAGGYDFSSAQQI